jgi:hypothetical protein
MLLARLRVDLKEALVQGVVLNNLFSCQRMLCGTCSSAKRVARTVQWYRSADQADLRLVTGDSPSCYQIGTK